MGRPAQQPLPPSVSIYEVGGAVRDNLLGLPVKDHDFVVVGATPEQMLAAGYRQVGADFPVFLHPDTAQEYALARTERKAGRGYKGFAIDASPSVTLEEDLSRRDLTINAIARADDGSLVDPYGGVADLQQRVLRHVSAAFVEDPLRVLRVARFAARFAALGFTVADETYALMRTIAAQGELDTLVPERVLTELRKALTTAHPEVFLQVLRRSDALQIVLPEVDALYGVPQTAHYHPEVDTGTHVELVLEQAARLAPGDDMIGFAALTHDLGKALTPDTVLPSHRGHEEAGVEPLRALCERLRVPAEMRDLALLTCREHLNMHRLPEMRPATIVDLLMRMDAFRKPVRVEQFALVCEADSRGRQGQSDRDYPQHELLLNVFAAARGVSAKDLNPELQGPAMGEAMRLARIDAVRAVLARTATE